MSRGEASVPLPKHDPACTAISADDAPSIEEPKDGDVFRLRRGVEKRFQQIALSASAASESLWWFVDGELIDRSAPGGTVLLDPIPGPHLITAVDTEGKSDRVRITVLP